MSVEGGNEWGILEPETNLVGEDFDTPDSVEGYENPATTSLFIGVSGPKSQGLRPKREKMEPDLLGINLAG